MTPNQRRVLEAAGVTVTEGRAPALAGIPVRVLDGPDPDTVYLVNASDLWVSPPGGAYPDLAAAALAGLKVRFPAWPFPPLKPDAL